MRTIPLILLLIGLAFGPALCGPSAAVAADAGHAGVTRALDSRDGHPQPSVAVGSPVLVAPSLVAVVDLGLAPVIAPRILDDVRAARGPIGRRTPLRL